MATLFINTSDSRCGECKRNADPEEKSHEMKSMGDVPGCGAIFDAVSSEYLGGKFGGIAFEDRIKEMRPDLPLVWERFVR